MAQELPTVTVATPGATTTFSPFVHRRIWGRLLDMALIFCAGLAALLQSLGDINLASLGFTPTEAAWIGLGLFVLRFILAQFPFKRVELRQEPPAEGQG